MPRPSSLPVSGNPAAKRVEGLTLKDQRTSNGGNSFSLEPPDQALCVSGGQLIEGVNDVFSIYDKTSGTALSSPQAYNRFFNNTNDINRTPGAANPYGPFVSDPKCYFDPALQRFYMTVLELGTDPATGSFTGTSYVDIAVSKSATPTTDPRDWYLYQLDVANSGGTDTTTGSAGGTLQSHPGCPCLGDQPLIGADAHGFFITTNEFPIAGAGFNGAQLYALDKVALTTGTLKVQRFESPNGIPLAEGVAYTVQPATSPDPAEWSTDANGTEYALSALEFTGGFDNRIASWAFTNTASLATANPAVQLNKVVIGSEVYGAPPKVLQKTGPYPLGQSLKTRLNLLDSNDDRMNQVVYSGHLLWSGLNTAVKTENGPTTTGIAYFVVAPRPTTATMANQGYIAVNRNSVMYPSIGVSSTATGNKAAMVFTLAGRGYYPSTAYVTLGRTGAVSSGVEIYGAGTKPADGFTGYPQYGGTGVERWGDYSAAVADTAGTVWTAAEYIPGTFGYPPYLANWGTAVGAIS
ncbi:MAG: hypothetical protein M3Z00_00070 [Actinomycetota bacterium]|nr:hypothetical protein [Actinomycetota bacterium]